MLKNLPWWSSLAVLLAGVFIAVYGNTTYDATHHRPYYYKGIAILIFSLSLSARIGLTFVGEFVQENFHFRNLPVKEFEKFLYWTCTSVQFCLVLATSNLIDEFFLDPKNPDLLEYILAVFAMGQMTWRIWKWETKVRKEI